MFLEPASCSCGEMFGWGLPCRHFLCVAMTRKKLPVFANQHLNVRILLQNKSHKKTLSEWGISKKWMLVSKVKESFGSLDTCLERERESEPLEDVFEFQGVSQVNDEAEDDRETPSESQLVISTPVAQSSSFRRKLTPQMRYNKITNLTRLIAEKSAANELLFTKTYSFLNYALNILESGVNNEDMVRTIFNSGKLLTNTVNLGMKKSSTSSTSTPSNSSHSSTLTPSTTTSSSTVVRNPHLPPAKKKQGRVTTKRYRSVHDA